MSSPAQITANRANAQFSTGPRSVEGKAASSRNSLKFGVHAQSMLIPGEDPEELATLTADYHRDLQPQGAVETALVETLIRCDWMRRRLYRIEAEVIAAQMGKLDDPTENPLAQVYLDDAAGHRLLQSIARRLDSLQRDYFRALKEMKAIIKTRTESEMFRLMAAPAPTGDRLRFSPPSPNPPRTPSTPARTPTVPTPNS